MNKDIIAKNLLRLRDYWELTQGEVAKKADISLPAYRNIEAGESEPKITTLQNLAKVFDVDYTELLIPQKELKYVRFRADKTMKKKPQVISYVAWWLENFNYLESLLKSPGKTNCIAIDFKTLNKIQNRPIEAAAIARTMLGLNEEEPIRDICGLLEENAGIKICTKVFNSDKFFGLSVSERDGGPAIVVNIWNRITVERRIFSTVHEFGHILLHLNAYDISETEENAIEEDEANKFAAYFLMPDEAFKKEWNANAGLSFVDRILKVKKIFNVSYGTVIYRLTEFFPKKRNDIWSKFYGEYKTKTGKSLTRIEEPEPLPQDFNNLLTEPDPLSETYFMNNRLAKLVRKALKKKLITIEKGSDFLNLEVDEMERLYESWHTNNFEI